MKSITQIADKLEPGDLTFIAKVAGTSEAMVRLVFAGQRNPEYGKGKKIYQVADAWINYRDNFRYFFEKHADNYDPNSAYLTYVNQSMEEREKNGTSVLQRLRSRLNKDQEAA